ncbi:MAG: amino acid ABC transporter substrate-binding protein [Psychromonas sp.]|nr:amino acid ABC transporter substrate-binding protein [Alteromonadales bacterium]MCP5076841.1 amino acid ABC transporter substrate-binding protein [Psychromonas sp.]
MLKTLLFSLLFLLYSASPLSACSIDIYANKEMKPKVYLEAGKAKGILVEMMEYIGDDIGCQFNFKFSTWARAYKNMIDGNGGVIGLSKTKTREKIINYSDVMYVEDILLVTHIDHTFEYSTFNDLAGKSIITSRGAHFSDEFDKAVKSKIFTLIIDNGDIAKRLERVAKKRADVAIINPGMFSFNNAFVTTPELLDVKDQLYIMPTPFYHDPNYLGFSKKHDHQAFLKKFNHSMKKAKELGIFSDIEDKYHQLQE